VPTEQYPEHSFKELSIHRLGGYNGYRKRRAMYEHPTEKTSPKHPHPSLLMER
jgi:hypothetical protein